MSWYQLSAENTNLTGLTKYSLTPDLKSLASIKNFPTVAYKMLTLHLLSDNRIIGIGETCITIWSYNNGDVLSSMMTSNRIGQNLACVEYSMVVSFGQNLPSKTGLMSFPSFPERKVSVPHQFSAR
jgi:hypothetical protein